MKSTLHTLVLGYLLLNLLLASVNALPEVSPASQSLTPQLNPDNGRHGNVVNLEKRAAPRQYNFGIGKKSYNTDIVDDEAGHDSDSYEDDMGRADQNRLAYGLSKKASAQRFAFGIGKKSSLPSIDSYGKRINENQRFQFGLGKRASRDNRFSFGLGKRENDVEEYIKRRYSFGLGKRSAQDSLQSYYSSGRR